MPQGAAERAALERAKARLDRLGLYPEPVRLDGVRVVVAPWFFRLPRLRRFAGFATHRVILLKRPLGPGGTSEDLLTHELCHVWQMQHHPLHMPWTNLYSYETNPYELEARRAAAVTSERAAA